MDYWVILGMLGLLVFFQPSFSGVYAASFTNLNANSKLVSLPQSSFVGVESPDHSFTLKYPKNWNVLQSLTSGDGKVYSVVLGPSYTRTDVAHKEMVEILRVIGLPARYSVNDLVDDYMAYSRKIFGRTTFFVTDLGSEKVSSLQGRSLLVSITSYYPLDSYQTFAVHNNEAYILAYFGGIYYQKYFEQARNIMKSIELKGIIQGSND